MPRILAKIGKKTYGIVKVVLSIRNFIAKGKTKKIQLVSSIQYISYTD